MMTECEDRPECDEDDDDEQGAWFSMPDLFDEDTDLPYDG